jgi:hypothetical protein
MNDDQILDYISNTEDTAFLGTCAAACLARRKEVNAEIKARRAELDNERAGLKLRNRRPKQLELDIEPEETPKKKKKKQQR